MSLIRKNVTSKQLVANRANALKATGPRTGSGKREVGLNAVRQGIFAQISVAGMRELGEDPGEFATLRQSLHKTFRPQDEFERLLVEDLAQNRWRRQRLLRAERGMLASERRAFEMDHAWRVASAGKGERALAEQIMVSKCGLAGAWEFAQATKILKGLRQQVQEIGFGEGQAAVLELVYGKAPGLAGAALIAAHQRLNRQGEGGPPEAELRAREGFIHQLQAEIRAFEKLAELHRQRELEITEGAKDAHMLPTREDLDKILRYEAALESQFQRRLRQLAAWRRNREGSALEETLEQGRGTHGGRRGRPVESKI